MKTRRQIGRGGDLAKYDPEHGLKSIAVAEAAEKHFARAKDATQLTKAIRAKLEAQADFVHWWDTRGPGASEQRARDNGQRYRPETVAAGKNGLPPRIVVHRWRKRLGAEDAFEATYQAALARYIAILELGGAGAHVGHNSGENEWYTPAGLITPARTVLGEIDLDPASSDAANRVVKASQIFTADESGLEQPWHGRVWMNPPYSQPLIDKFCDKFARHAAKGDITGIALVNNATETAWFQRLASVATCLCFPKGRVKFWSTRGDSAAPLQGQALIYTGADAAAFTAAFRAFGIVVERRP